MMFHLKMILQSVLRMLRVCFHFCFEFVDMLHFGNKVREVFDESLHQQECSMS